jgi:hypothetical protein
MEPIEAGLREIAGELQGEKAKAQKMAKPLRGSKNPHLREKACEMVEEAGKMSQQGQGRVQKLRRRLASSERVQRPAA